MRMFYGILQVILQMVLLTPHVPLRILLRLLLETWGYNVYERVFKVKRGFVVLDVGAHVGVFTLKASKEAGKEGLVVACEPHPTTYALLLTNLRGSRCENVVPLNIALCDFEGEGKLFVSPSSMVHSLAFKRDRWIRVNVDTLDNTVRKLGLKRVDFIKIDVEGAELQALRGAEETLEKFKPILSIAAYHTPTEVDEITETLSSKGYRILTIESYIYASQHTN